MADDSTQEQYILALDIGTTTVKSVIYNKRLEQLSIASRRVNVVDDAESGLSEIEPDHLWQVTLEAIEESIKSWLYLNCYLSFFHSHCF